MSVIPIDRPPSPKRGGPKPPRDDDAPASKTMGAFLATLKMVRDPSGRVFGVFGPELIPADTQKFLDRLSFEFHRLTHKTCSKQEVEKALSVVRGDPAICSSVVPYRYAYGN